MPAQILVESGLTSGTRYWIDKNVTRIGSGSASDLCLPSSQVPSHAITIEFRDGCYRVYNRSRRAIHHGKKEIPPGESFQWTGARSILLPGDTSLAFEVDRRDPTPAPRPADHSDDDDDDDVDPVTEADLEQESETIQRTKTVNGKTIGQILVLIFCAAASWYMLDRDAGRSLPSENVMFEKIVMAGLKDQSTSKPLLARLKFAQAALVRKDLPTARRLFSRLHGHLIEQKREFVVNKRKVELAILNYVQYQHLRLR